jgi:hypothetical protein
MQTIYVGTEKGLYVLSEVAGEWIVAGTLLPECEISSVAKRNGGQSLLVGTRQKGLFHVVPNVGTVLPVAPDVLPKGIRCIATAPDDDDCLYVGCEPAAIYKSTDGGRSWKECEGAAALARSRNWKYPVPFIPPHIRHILVDREDPKRIYASAQIGGVLRSEDGGETWQDVVECIDPDVHAVAQHPANAQVLYASTGAGGFVGGPNPPPAPQGYPLYRSDDAGKSWSCITSGFTRRHSVPLHFYPKEISTIVIAAASDNPGVWWKRPQGADAVLMVSRDSGKSWTQLAAPGLPEAFHTMVEAIETEAGPSGRTYVGIGGEGTKMLPADKRSGAIFYAERLEGPWMQIPKPLPVVFSVTPA